MANPPANKFRWLRTGEKSFPEMLAAIKAARVSVQLETYTFEESAVGSAFRTAMIEARGRGVRVQVMVDALGSYKLPRDFWAELVAAGGEFRWFNPLNLLRFEYRDHRKVLVCDDAVAFIGGFNIAREYEGDGVERGWCDLGLAIEGPLAGELGRTFDESWARAAFRHHPFHGLRRARARRSVAGDDWQLILNGPGLGRNFLKAAINADLAGARRVQMIVAYFLPTWRQRRDLRRVARRGGCVQLILAGKTDVRLSKLASQRLYRSLLRAGVEIYEYQPQVLHAKLFLIDDQVYVGSANLDARSMDINYELMLRLGEAPAVAGGRKIFADTLRHCQRIEWRTWRKTRSLWTRLMERWAYFILARVDRYWAERHRRPDGRK